MAAVMVAVGVDSMK